MRELGVFMCMDVLSLQCSKRECMHASPSTATEGWPVGNRIESLPNSRRY